MPDDRSSDSAQAKYRELCRVFGMRLREFGFAGSAGKWRREFDDVVECCAFQRWKYNTKDQIQLAVNLGVYNRKLGEFYCMPHKPRDPGEIDCHWRQRLFVLAYGEDRWVEVSGASRVNEMAHELIELMCSVGFEGMERLRTNGSTLQYLKSDRWPAGWFNGIWVEQATVLAVLEGDAEKLRWARDEFCALTRRRGSQRTMVDVQRHFKRLAEFVKDPSVELDISA